VSADDVMEQLRYNEFQLAMALHATHPGICPGQGERVEQQPHKWSCPDCGWSYTLERLQPVPRRDRRRLRRAVKRLESARW
jgi:hypothetical protein